MNKKILLSVILLTAFIFSFNCVFAENTTNTPANTVNDSMNKAGNTVENAGNAVRDAGNSAMNAVNNVVDGTQNAINTLTEDRTDNNSNTGATNNHDNNNMSMTGTTNNGNRNYTTTRTANEGTLLGMNATTWTWLIMGIVGIAIIALVWYYSMQHDTANGNYDD